MHRVLLFVLTAGLLSKVAFSGQPGTVPLKADLKQIYLASNGKSGHLVLRAPSSGKEDRKTKKTKEEKEIEEVKKIKGTISVLLVRGDSDIYHRLEVTVRNSSECQMTVLFSVFYGEGSGKPYTGVRVSKTEAPPGGNTRGSYGPFKDDIDPVGFTAVPDAFLSDCPPTN